MKAERRHELKESDLIHYMGSARAFFQENARRIGTGVIVAAVVVSGGIFMVRSRSAALEDVWRRKAMLTFQSLEEGKKALDSLAAMSHDTSDARFLMASLAEQGTQALRLAQETPKPPDRELTRKAREAFEQLLSRFPDNPIVLGMSHCGLATVEENEFLLDSNPSHKDRARQHLSVVIDTASLNGLPFQRLALDRRNAQDSVFQAFKFAPAPWVDPAIQSPDLFTPVGQEPDYDPNSGLPCNPDPLDLDANLNDVPPGPANPPMPSVP